jgi:hypothetical protein
MGEFRDMENKINLEGLKQGMDFKWWVQSFSKYKAEATCVAYIDSRDVQDLLDKVVGPENWQCKYEEIKGNLFCSIGIFSNGQWIWKSDCGTESNVDKEKGEASDSFKRAAVKWGVGRFLYDLGMKKLPANEKKGSGNYPFVVDSNGKQVWDLTAHINNLGGNKSTYQAKKTEPVKTEKKQEVKSDSEKVTSITKNKLTQTEIIEKLKSSPDIKGLQERYTWFKEKYPAEVKEKWFQTAYDQVRDILIPKKSGESIADEAIQAGV